MTAPIPTTVKRTGEVVPFHQERITVAIYKAGASIGRHDRALAETLSDRVVVALAATYPEDLPPTVEDIQDVVERILIESGNAEIADAYISYRRERARMRSLRQADEIEFIPYKAMWQALDWAVEHDCYTIGKLNHIMWYGDERRLDGYIRASRIHDLLASIA